MKSFKEMSYREKEEYIERRDRKDSMRQDNVLQDIRQALGLAETDSSKDEEILDMPAKEQFRLYCQWNGLLGWSTRLENVVYALFVGYEEDCCGGGQIKWRD